MTMTVSSTALGQMTSEERGRLLDSVFTASPEALAQFIAVVDARLRVYETRYEMPSASVENALERGQLPDTAEVIQWLLWWDMRSRLGGQTRS